MSNYVSTMPWAYRLQNLSPNALADADVGRLIRRRRIGIFCFLVLLFLSVNNLNALAVMALGTERLFSIPMLVAAVVTLLVFQIALVRDMGPSGLLFILFLTTYLVISLPIGIQNFSLDFYVRAHWVRMHLTSLLVMAACAQGARHVMLAWSKQRLLLILYLITLVQVLMVFVGMAFPKLIYADSGPLIEGRFSGFFRNPNAAGMASCACVAVGFAYLTVAKHKMWVIACMLLASVATVLTFSRSAFLTLFLLIVFQVLMSPVVKRKSILIVTLISMGFLTWFATVGVFSFVDVNYTQSARLESLKRILTLQIDMEEDTGDRFVAASAAIGHWFDSPVVGNGFTTMRRMPETGLGPHNQYLLVLGEGGLLPLGTMFLFLGVFMYQAWKCKDRSIRSLGLGVGFVFACSCMVSHTELTNRSIAALLGVCMGTYAAVNYRTRVLEGMKYAARMVYPAAAVPDSRLPQGPAAPAIPQVPVPGDVPPTPGSQ